MARWSEDSADPSPVQADNITGTGRLDGLLTRSLHWQCDSVTLRLRVTVTAGLGTVTVTEHFKFK